MRRRRTGPTLVGVLAVALLATSCSGSSSPAATTSSASPGLLNGRVTLAADRAMTPVERRQVMAVLRARLAALHIDADLTVVGDRAVRLRVPAPTVTVVRELGAPGRFEIRPVETFGPKGQQPVAPLGTVPAPIAGSAGGCSVTAPGDLQGWLVACDPKQQTSYLLWPADLTNADVASASETPQSAGQWSVNVTFTSAGKQRFFTLTQRSVGMQLAFVVDGVVEIAPVDETALNTAAPSIGMMNQPAAQLMATLVGNGALTVALHPQGAVAG